MKREISEGDNRRKTVNIARITCSAKQVGKKMSPTLIGEF